MLPVVFHFLSAVHIHYGSTIRLVKSHQVRLNTPLSKKMQEGRVLV